MVGRGRTKRSVSFEVRSGLAVSDEAEGERARKSRELEKKCKRMGKGAYQACYTDISSHPRLQF